MISIFLHYHFIYSCNIQAWFNVDHRISNYFPN
ncbi:tryptophanase leader peptide [Photorhabdus tasmaniensis]|uniref:Tryptophanase leader peptide n=4 Tax=Photorhabdus TaxID=29487 RepID=A0A4R4JST1_9GAMM|nr:tryptophanase leader peptide [Photorhabdus khanii]NHB89393.1 tryptophanase leader peptide [Photorhabdus tasmaniensis]NHB98131.1 tryptophanase leader peptide [Photorhabdus stackebrandtii]TDB56831.1 tryptophanase leader peptide [Photorhabdus khanii subsp. guanajuatensis]